MNVFFDFEVDPNPLYEKAHERTLEYQEKLKDFVRQRLNVLKEDIEREEAELKKDEDGEEIKNFTLLWRRENTFIPIGIHHMGYSDSLKNKMKGCFTTEDIKYINSSFPDLL